MGTTPERLGRNYRGTSDNQWFRIKEIDRSAILYLIRNLENFEKDNAIKAGLLSAGEVFKVGGRKRLRDRMKSGNKGVTGNLLNSFHVRVKRSKSGVLTGFKQGTDGGSHAHLVDRGTEERFYKTSKGKRKSTGRVIGSRFWADTESEDYPKAMRALYDGIERAVNRISNRG